MARVYFEYTKNTLLEYPDYFMFAFFVATIFMFVSIRDVLINIPKDSLPNLFNFLVAALRNTSWIIQALIVGFLLRVSIVGSRLIYKNVRNVNTGWVMSKFRY